MLGSCLRGSNGSCPLRPGRGALPSPRCFEGPAMPARFSDPGDTLIFLLRHPLRKQLLALYLKEAQMLSPKELADYTREPLANVSLHVRVLRDHGALELVRER